MMRHYWILTLWLASAALGQQPAEAPREVDVTKRRVVERPTEELVAALSESGDPAAAPAAEVKRAPADPTKRDVIEPSAEAIVRRTLPADAPSDTPADDNPRVEPGKVHWHDDLAAATAAAKASGKPVLVFHLLGELDQRFT